MPDDRIHPDILPHLQAVLTALAIHLPPEVKSGEWMRPLDVNKRFGDPPYVLVRVFPSAAQFNGALDQTQADIVVRFQVLSVGMTESQALRVGDLARAVMRRSKVIVPSRYVQDLRLMVAAGGIARDDDLPTPFFYSTDLFELATTPA